MCCPTLRPPDTHVVCVYPLPLPLIHHSSCQLIQMPSWLPAVTWAWRSPPRRSSWRRQAPICVVYCACRCCAWMLELQQQLCFPQSSNKGAVFGTLCQGCSQPGCTWHPAAPAHRLNARSAWLSFLVPEPPAHLLHPPFACLPFLSCSQKLMIQKCNLAGKPVVTATQASRCCCCTAWAKWTAVMLGYRRGCWPGHCACCLGIS